MHETAVDNIVALSVKDRSEAKVKVQGIAGQRGF